MVVGARMEVASLEQALLDGPGSFFKTIQCLNVSYFIHTKPK